ncbi:hypothetical protein [uncultured Mediterranean phage]|nr:hypothetical protein [uncultured Mediterranean phage]
MSGGGTTVQYQQQPYGEALAESLKAQVDLLRGEGEFEDTGGLQELLTKYEAPLRKETAQIDTDVLRQTLLGDQQQQADSQGRVITGYTTPEAAGGGDALGGYQIVNLGTESDTVRYGARKQSHRTTTTVTYGLMDSSGELVLTESADTQVNNADPDLKAASKAGLKSLMDKAREQNLLTAQQATTGTKAEPIYETDPESGEVITDEWLETQGKPGRAGTVVREGTGMLDLFGPTEAGAVTKQVTTGDERFEAFVNSNQNLRDRYAAESRKLADRGQEVPSVSEFGRDYYFNQGGKERVEAGEMEAVPSVGESYQVNRRAGFDPQTGEFLGLTTLGADVSEQLARRQRAADIYDVGQLGEKATDAYRTKGITEALGTAKGLGPGGTHSAIPGKLFDKSDLQTTAQTLNQNVDAITGERFSGELGSGQDVLRQALLGEAKAGLGQGLTARELENIEQGSRIASGARGRMRDKGSIQREVEARVLEDRQRQAMNRAFAQQTLGQEAGLQTGDLGRGMQAQLANLARQEAAVGRELGAAESDAERAMRQQAMQEQYRQAGLGQERAAAAQMVGLEQATSADPFQAILQRPSGAGAAMGQQMFGQAGYGLQSQPQYLRPEAGLGFISQGAANQANIAAAQAAASGTRQAGLFSGLGSALGGWLGG